MSIESLNLFDVTYVLVLRATQGIESSITCRKGVGSVQAKASNYLIFLYHLLRCRPPSPMCRNMSNSSLSLPPPPVTR